MNTDEIKVCPYCGEEIKSIAVKCRFCGSILGDSPVTGQTWVISPDSIVKQALAEKYELLEAVGTGGMATVYKAVQKSLGRIVALKVIHQNLVHDQEFVRRFLREAQLAASLNHPNIVTVFDVGSYGQVHYMAMEFLEGEDLQHLMKKQGRLVYGELVKWIIPIAEALAYIHKNGLMHRDVKSPNIFITKSGRPVLTDFGIAFEAEGTKLTQAGSIVGTPEYMSPEQANGKEFTAKSDLWSLGIVMFECLSGRVPFQGDNPLTTIHLVTQAQPPAITTLNPQVPHWVESVIFKLLAKNPSERFADGYELAAALREAKEVKIVKAEQKATRENKSPEKSFKIPSKVILATIGVVVLVILVASVVWLTTNKPIQKQTVTQDKIQLNDSLPTVKKQTTEKAKQPATVLPEVAKPANQVTEKNSKSEGANQANGEGKVQLTSQNQAEGQAIPVGLQKFNMALVQGGLLKRGNDGEPVNAGSKNPIVQSTKINSFFIGKFEVTQGLWEEIMGSNPSVVKGKELPVESVTWNEVQNFIAKLNQQNNANFRLPTEAEWEFAATGGNKTKGYLYSGSNNISEVGWILGPTVKPHPVGMKKANELGLYDMTGNVDEWCSDWNSQSGNSSPGDGTGTDSGTNQVVRGGSWNALAGSFRAASANYKLPDNRIPNLGLRLAYTPK